MATTPLQEEVATSLAASNNDLAMGMSGSEVVQQLMATLELQYFKAVSLYRRRNYEKCVQICNAMLQAGQLNNVQIFNAPSIVARIPGSNSYAGVLDVNADTTTKNLNPNTLVSLNTSSSGNMGSYGISRYGSNLQRNAHRPNIIPRLKGELGVGKQQVVHATPATIMPTWMMEGVWQLKMRALTQSVFIDDLDTYDLVDEVYEQDELERIATTARPGTSIKNTYVPRPRTSILRTTTSSGGKVLAAPATESRKLNTATIRPVSGIARPGTGFVNRPSTRCGTASRIRAISAATLNTNDNTGALFQAAKHNPTIYAERTELVKTLYQYLYYYESDIPKAYALCEAVFAVQQKKLKQQNHNAQIMLQLNADTWWWQQQMGRCLLIMRHYRSAELHLQQSLQLYAHPDTYLLLCRLYQRMKTLEKALTLINEAVDKTPFDVNFRLEQGHLFDMLKKPDDALLIFRLIIKLNPVNVEALAGIADNYFYDNNPELALMYYRRILALGEHTPEIYCNIGLCCLYGGQIDLVYPCFRRALALAKTPNQKADIWYNASFVAVTTGDFILARRCLQLCLVNDAHNAAALNNLAVLSAYNCDYLKAKSYLTAARQLIYEAPEIEKNWQYLDEHYKL